MSSGFFCSKAKVGAGGAVVALYTCMLYDGGIKLNVNVGPFF